MLRTREFAQYLERIVPQEVLPDTATFDRNSDVYGHVLHIVRFRYQNIALSSCINISFHFSINEMYGFYCLKLISYLYYYKTNLQIFSVLTYSGEYS